MSKEVKEVALKEFKEGIKESVDYFCIGMTNTNNGVLKASQVLYSRIVRKKSATISYIYEYFEAFVMKSFALMVIPDNLKNDYKKTLTNIYVDFFLLALPQNKDITIVNDMDNH